jgi:putative transposase
LPWLYLKGVSSGEMGEALKVLIGVEAKGLSASTVSRLKQIWGQEYRSWRDGPLDKDRWVRERLYKGINAWRTRSSRCETSRYMLHVRQT